MNGICDETSRMREQARESALEMQRRSRFCEESEENKDRAPGEREKKEKHEGQDRDNGRERYRCQKNTAQKKNGLASALYNVFGKLTGEETEKMLVVALCLLLLQEECDNELIIALMYIIT